MAGPRIRAVCFFSGKGQSDYVVASPNYGYGLMSTSELLGKQHGAAALAGSYLTQLRPSAELVPETGIEPVRPLFTKAADFKSAVSTNSTTRAMQLNA